MLVTETLHDHCFAHSTVTVYGDGRHSRPAWMIDQEVEAIEYLLGTRINEPAT
ncbi:hypothetical protein SJ05684_a38420 (plasmid) [Sinorhizobium sojae CCBAU 05684]|uniref:Uncharacterized protein n=1 Tax=Sinorhizobium sojae CCBAU 05684 TaxID=716928 RepID=A0A249PMX0_9HYPH|nr:hypothetical protein SJ05684_a38420 [Sinorhizobium sojae CCBAU 05684]